MRANAKKRSHLKSVRDRVAELRTEIAKETVIIATGQVDKAEEARLLAMQLERPGDAVRAIEPQCKIAGVGSWNDKGAGVNVQTVGPMVINVSYRREPLQIEQAE
jgi:hypothetical protein